MTMERRFPFLQFHRCSPVYSLRVHWVPLFPSSQRLGAFAVSPRPGCTQLSWVQTTMPHPTFPAASGFRWGLPCLLSTPLCIQQEISRVHNEGLKRNAVGGVLLNAPSPLWGSPI